MSAVTPVVAAFDVDGTLTNADCVRPFLLRLAGWRGLAATALRAAPRSVTALVHRDRDRLKEIVVGGVFRDRDVDEVRTDGEQFAEVILAEMLRPDALARLRWHQAEGHRTVLVSASLRPYLDPLGAALGLDGVLCTDVAAQDERYLGTLVGGNCRGPEKAIRLRGWLGDRGLADAELWAYGDSRGDREMLAMAHHAVWVAGSTLSAVPDETTA